MADETQDPAPASPWSGRSVRVDWTYFLAALALAATIGLAAGWVGSWEIGLGVFAAVLNSRPRSDDD